MSTGNVTRAERREVNGLLLLNKPAGWTSNQALQRVKRLFNARKAGHTGSLDPAATGMLPLCFGEATKVCAYLLAADKTYRVTARLGVATDTGDADGQVIETADLPELDGEGWLRLLQGFVGSIRQVPPMYSALKKDGKRLYELARQGRVVEREPRDIEIHAIELLESGGARLVFRVTCSKGTYVRALVEDIASAAGTVAHTAHLHRERVGHFNAEDMLDMEAAEQAAKAGAAEVNRQLLPADQALADWPAARIPADAAERFVGGRRVPLDEDQRPAAGARLRVYDGENRFLGVGELTGDGWLAPRRVFRQLQHGTAGPQRGTRAGQAAAPEEPAAGTADCPEFQVCQTITGPVETLE